MLLKKLVAVVSAVVVIAVPYVKVLADDTVITLDETAKKFVVIDKNLEYRDMLPGEERSSVIKISNSSAENMEFYINGKVLDNLADKGTGDQTALTFYYQFGSDQELAQLPPAEKLSKITYLYECEFRRPILQLLESGISGAGEQKHIYETATDRGSRKKYETLQIFFGAHPEHILEQMMEE